MSRFISTTFRDMPANIRNNPAALSSIVKQIADDRKNLEDIYRGSQSFQESKSIARDYNLLPLVSQNKEVIANSSAIKDVVKNSAEAVSNISSQLGDVLSYGSMDIPDVKTIVLSNFNNKVASAQSEIERKKNRSGEFTLAGFPLIFTSNNSIKVANIDKDLSDKHIRYLFTMSNNAIKSDIIANRTMSVAYSITSIHLREYIDFLTKTLGFKGAAARGKKFMNCQSIELFKKEYLGITTNPVNTPKAPDAAGAGETKGDGLEIMLASRMAGNHGHLLEKMILAEMKKLKMNHK